MLFTCIHGFETPLYVLPVYNKGVADLVSRKGFILQKSAMSGAWVTTQGSQLRHFARGNVKCDYGVHYVV